MNSSRLKAGTQKKVIIWDCGDIPPDMNFVYLWSGYHDNDHSLSLLRLLEKYSDELRSRFFKIRSELLKMLSESYDLYPKNTEIAKHLLWMSLLVESSTFKSPCLLDVMRLLTLDKVLVGLEFESIMYVGPKASVADSIRQLSKNKNHHFIWQQTSFLNKGSLLRKVWRRLPDLLRALIWLTKHVLDRWPLRKKYGNDWNAGKDTVSLFGPFAHLDPNRCASGIFYSKLWERLPEFLQNSGKRINWTHLFLISKDVPDTSTGKSWLKAFNNDSLKQGVHVFMDMFLDGRMIISILKDWRAAQKFYYSWSKKSEYLLEMSEYGWLWPLLKNDWRDSMIGVTSIHNILIRSNFDRLLKDLPRQSLGIYICENQNWERILLHTWRQHGHGTIIGVAHSTVRYWDLRYFDESMADAIPDLPQPDKLAVNGPNAWNNLEKSGCTMKSFVSVEAPRYLYLNHLPKKQQSFIKGKDKRILLVLGDFKRDTTHHMALDLEEVFFKLKSNYQVWIKSHPANTISLEHYPKLKAQLKAEPLKDLFPHVDVALASIYTSASLDAYCSGIPVINHLDPDDFNFSCLRNIDGVPFVSSADEFFIALEQIECGDFKVGNPEDFFWLDQDLTYWNNLLDGTGLKHVQ